MDRGIYEPMFDDRNYENILDENLSRIDDAFDKREGSIIYDALAPMSIEVSMLYSYLDFLFKNAFGDTSNRYWLTQRAKERGIEPYPATPATIIGKFNVYIDIGERFSIDDIYYKVVKFVEERESYFYYELLCEKVGTVGNIKKGNLIPSRTIRDLSVSEISSLAILGENDEETEDFRQRYFETIKNNAYGGNIDDYRQKVRAIEGVGLVKVIPVWNGGGTVKLIVTDSKFKEPTKELVLKVQEKVDPIPYHQKGVGIAPVGHYVTVVGAKKKEVNITCKITKSRDGILENIRNKIKEDLEVYFEGSRKKWATFDKADGELYVENDIRLTKIMSIVLNVPGVIDFSEIKFTDSDDKILILKEEEIPILGKIDISEV